MRVTDSGPVSHRDARGAQTGRGAPAVDLDREASRDWARKQSRGRPRSHLARLAKEKMSQADNKDRESRTGDGNNAKINSNKISNKDEQANCRKQMKKPRPAPNLVFDVFSPAWS